MYAAQIQTGELRAQDLPTTYGDWSDYARFAVTFAPQDREGCREFASARVRALAQDERGAAHAARAARVPLVRAAQMALHGPRARLRRDAVRSRPDPGDADDFPSRARDSPPKQPQSPCRPPTTPVTRARLSPAGDHLARRIVRRVLPRQDVVRPLAALPLRDRRLDIPSSARNGNGRRACTRGCSADSRKDLCRVYAHDQLCLRILRQQRIVVVDRRRAV